MQSLSTIYSSTEGKYKPSVALALSPEAPWETPAQYTNTVAGFRL
jgi:hypothetical protein